VLDIYRSYDSSGKHKEATVVETLVIPTQIDTGSGVYGVDSRGYYPDLTPTHECYQAFPPRLCWPVSQYWP